MACCEWTPTPSTEASRIHESYTFCPHDCATGRHSGAAEGVPLFKWSKGPGLQARFMLLTSPGLLAVAVCSVVLVGWFEAAKVEQKLRTASESELLPLNALVSSAMEQRVTDTKDVAVTVFNRWFEHRNADYPGKVWSVWSP
jgi:hypothetical protein